MVIPLSERKNVTKLMRKALNQKRKLLDSIKLTTRLGNVYGEIDANIVKTLDRIINSTILHIRILETLIQENCGVDNPLVPINTGSKMRLSRIEVLNRLAELADMLLHHEKGMVEIYQEIAWRTESRLVNKIALALAEDELEQKTFLLKLRSLARE